jgi:hypothetical protein
LKRSEVFFNIRVSPAFYVRGCAVKLDQESRGLMGFHNFGDCPNCEVTFKGFEFWGENGHLQGTATDRVLMVSWLAYKARHQWRRVDGRLMGYRFAVGRALFYRSHN